jgi:hypothetical protein
MYKLRKLKTILPLPARAAVMFREAVEVWAVTHKKRNL